MLRTRTDVSGSFRRAKGTGTERASLCGMTAPRQILPGTTYLVTRRCTQRQFLLRPSPRTHQVFLFVLAVVVQRYRIRLHAFNVLSNHFHLVLTDPEAKLPEFMRDLASLVARALNTALSRSEAFWGPPTYSAVALASPKDIVDKTVYVLGNPVSAGLVERARDWPGACSPVELLGGGVLKIERPAGFFRPDGPMPASVAFELTVAPGFSSGAEFQERVAATLAVREEKAARELRARGRTFVGAERVRAQDPSARPTSFEPLRRLNPRIAARDAPTRIAALAALTEFRRAYRVAWAKFKAGVRDVLFPAGTYGLRVVYGVRCAT